MSDQNHTITLGGWYQRTTLHLTEIFEFFSSAKSKLNLNPKTLQDYHQKLGLKEVAREAGYLEYVQAQTKNGLEIRYFEDGLYVLTLNGRDLNRLRQKQAQLEDYFGNCFEPAVAYIFSLGAPTPKILANIKTSHPIVVNLYQRTGTTFKVNTRLFGQIYSQIESEQFNVYKTLSHIFILSKTNDEKASPNLTEMQIFFREFKDQLEKYLQIHRQIWEEIAKTKERKFVRGGEVVEIRNNLDAYQKTVGLISSRLNQMSSYVATRQSIAKNLNLEKELDHVFQYKFETLIDTHRYIRELWEMTKNYLENAIKLVVEIQTQSTNASVQSLRTITTVGTIALMTTWLSRDKFPYLTTAGLLYFLILLVLTWLVNHFVYKAYQNRKYKLTFGERKTDI